MATNFSNKNISTIQLQGIDYHLKSIPFHATEEEWKLIDYIPKQGETVVYDIDGKNQNLRFKTGDGFTQVKNLPFSLSTVQETQSQIDNAVAQKSQVQIITWEADD